MLRQRVRNQAATIERQADRIVDLEAELDTLRTTIVDRKERLKTSTDQAEPPSAGILTRIRWWLQDDHAE